MKKILCLALSLLVAVSFVLPTMAAQITWDPSDLQESVIFETDFEDGTALSSGTLDSTTFASDPAHNKVLSSTNFIWDFSNGNLKNWLKKDSKITVKFDYFASGTDNLRVEVRSIAEKEETGASVAKYWDSAKDLPYKSVENDGWHTFEGTFNMSDYYNNYLIKNNAETAIELNKAVIYVKLANGTQLYTDNIKITAEPTVLPLVEPTFTYASNLNAVTSEDPIAAGHKNVYKTSLAKGSETSILTGAAPGYFKEDGTYKLSFSYYQKEAEDSATTQTKLGLLRFKNDNGVVNVWTGKPNPNFYVNNGNVNTWLTDSATLYVSKNNQYVTTENDYTNKLKPLIDNGKFTITIQSDSAVSDFYIADVKLVREPEISANSNTVAFEENQVVGLGESCSIEVKGYYDETVAPKITIAGTQYTGTWANVTKDGELRTGNAKFEDLVAASFPTENSAQLSVTDIWGTVKTNPVTITFATSVNQKVEVLTGSWKSIRSQETEQAVTGSVWILSGAMTDYINAGTALVRFSFDVKGTKDADYSGLSTGIALRTGDSLDVNIDISTGDLATGEYKSYSVIKDLGGMNRYYGSPAKDRTTEGYSVMLRGLSNAPVTYKNVKVEIFDPTAAVKDSVVARLKITNNVDASFSPNGMLIFAEYQSSQLVDVFYKTVSYADEGTLKNGIAKDETKYVYITGNEVGGENMTISSALKEYNSDNTYRVYYWNDFEDIIPITDMGEK